MAEPQLPEGQRLYQQAIDGGMPVSEVEAWKRQKTDTYLRAGMPPDVLDAYWGNLKPDPTQLNDLMIHNLSGVPADKAQTVANSHVDAFAAGLGMSVSGLALLGHLPDKVLPEDAGTLDRILAGTGQMIGDFPFMVAGGFAAGVAGLETGPGALALAGAGAFALPEALRQGYIDYLRRGEVGSAKDFIAVLGQSSLAVAKSAIVGAASMVTGGAAGAVAAPVAGRAIGEGANVLAQAVTATTVGSVLEGHLPDPRDFTAAVVMMLGVHAAVKMTTRTKIVLTTPAETLKKNMEDVYAKYGVLPAKQIEMARQDPAFAQELLHRDVNDEVVASKFKDVMQTPEPYAEQGKYPLVTAPKEPAAEGGEGGPPVIPPKPSNAAEAPEPIKSTPEELNAMADKFVGEPKQPGSVYNVNKMYRQWVSELGPAEAWDRILEKMGVDKGQLLLEDMFRQTYASEMRAGHFILKGGIDPIEFNPTKVPPVMDAVKLVKENGGNLNDWLNWMVANRANDKEAQGFKTGHPLTPEQRVQMIEAGRSKYEAATAALQKTMDGVLEYARESGVFSHEQVEAMRRDNPIYVSFRRILGDTETMLQGKKSRRGFRVSPPVRRFEGDDRQILNPLLATIDNIHQIIRMADRNRAIGSVVTLAQQHGISEPMGLKQIEVKAKLAEPNSDDFKPYNLGHNGGPPLEEDMDPYKPFLAERAQRFGGIKPNQFMFIRDGKAELWEAKDADLARLMRGADTPGEANALIETFATVAKMARAGIITTPDFMARTTWFRDTLTGWISDPNHPPPFITWMKGLMPVLKMDAKYWDAVAKGAAGSAPVHMDIKFLERDISRIFTKSGTWEHLINTVSHPVEAAQLLFERVDMTSRVGYKEVMQERGMNPIKAATGARKAYLDFREKGTLALAGDLAKAIPFLRPSFLGLRQFGAGWKVDPAGVLWRSFVGITLPTALGYALNWLQDEYGDLPEDRKFRNLPRYWKDGMYVFPEVAGIRVRVPYPPVLGQAFGGLMTRVLDRFSQDDPKAFEQWSTNLLSAILPPFVPSLILPPIEQWANRSVFTGRALVPASLEKAHGPLQYTENTTEPAKALSRILGALDVNVSPIVLEDYVRNWTGTLGMDGLRLFNAPLNTSGKPWTMEDIPFVGSFLIRTPGMTAQPIQDFYEARQELQAKAADFALGRRRLLTGDLPAQLEFEKAAKKFEPLGTADAIADAIQTLQAVVEGINADKRMSDGEKLRNTDLAYSQMILLARAGNKAMQETHDAFAAGN